MVVILSISEMTVDENFRDGQFKIAGFRCNRLSWVDRIASRGGMMLLFRENLPVKILSVDKGNQSNT